MPKRPRKQKVVCYIFRDGQLLVFKHLDEPWDESGLQVPAGSIRPGESPDVAAMREACEETGLTELRLVRKVGKTVYDMAPYRPEVHHRHVFHLDVDEATPDRWVSTEDDPDDGSTPKRFECYWIPLPKVTPCQAVRAHCSAISDGPSTVSGSAMREDPQWRKSGGS